MYLRFRTSFTDHYMESRYGVFQAAHFLLHSDTMFEYDQDRLQEVWGWFSRNLSAPDKFKQKKVNSNIICWFKPTARMHLQKMHEMTDILELYGYSVSHIKCRKPGYVVYEDDEQVAVIPFTKLVKCVR